MDIEGRKHKTDIEGANKAIKYAWIAATISAGLTLIFAVTGLFGLDLWALWTVIVTLGLAFGIYKKNRACAVILFVFWVVGAIWEIAVSGVTGSLPLQIVFAICFFWGIRGTFAYHRIVKAETKEESLYAEKSYAKSPWNPSVFYALTILCGFGAAGILAGINYGRLGKPELKWPTISISLVLFTALFAFTMITGWDKVGLAYLINLPFAILLERIQRPLYKRYKEVNTSAKGGGWGIPVLTGVASIALVFASAAIGVAFIIPWGVDVGDITSIEIGRAMTGTIDSRTDMDTYSFKAVEGKCYVIETSKPLTAEPLENPFLTLWDSDRTTVLTCSTEYGNSRQSRIEWVAEATGTFYITVDSADKLTTGDYILTVSCVSE